MLEGREAANHLTPWCRVRSRAEEGQSEEVVKRSHHPTIGAVAGDHFPIRWLLDTISLNSETFGFHFSKMVEIHDGERPFQAVGGKEVDELDNPTPLKPRSRHPLDRDYLSGATLSDEIPTVLRSDPQIREYLRQLNNRMAKKDRMINALRKEVHMVAMAIRLHTPSPSRGGPRGRVLM